MHLPSHKTIITAKIANNVFEGLSGSYVELYLKMSSLYTIQPFTGLELLY